MIAKTYLHNLYSDKDLSCGIHLEGGAALSLYYGIERVFSNDLDFTAENKTDLLRFRKDIIKPLGNDYSYVHINDTKTNIYQKDGSLVLSLDYFLADPYFCCYNKVLLDGKTLSSIHSLIDILAEKLCCMVNRDASRDVYDTAKIIKSLQPSYRELSHLYNRKQKVKKSDYITLDFFISNMETLKISKENWSEKAVAFNDISSFLKNSLPIKKD